MQASPSKTSVNDVRNDVRPQARPTKEQLALLLAMWAQNKPDSLCERVELSKRSAGYRTSLHAAIAAGKQLEQDNIIPNEDTGATLLDSNNMIMSVAGSGATHAAAYLCNRFPQQASGGTICLSKRPCSFCTKLMIQRGVRRIIVPEMTGSHLTRFKDTDTDAIWLKVICVDEFGRPLGKERFDEFQVLVNWNQEGDDQETEPEQLDHLQREAHHELHSFSVKCNLAQLQPPSEFVISLRKSGRTVQTVRWKWDRETPPEAISGMADRSSAVSRGLSYSDLTVCLSDAEGKRLEAECRGKPEVECEQIRKEFKKVKALIEEAEREHFEQEGFKLKPNELPKQQPIEERSAFVNSLLQRGNAALSSLDLPPFLKEIYSKLIKHYNDNYIMIERGGSLVRQTLKNDSSRAWLLGLCILASLRSEDEDARVGAVLAKTLVPELPKKRFSIEVFGVGYNGSKKEALHRDFVQGDDDKGKWALHAEQNLFMFRCIDDASDCELYTTHSPCIQCSGIVRSMGIEKVFYVKPYRPPCFEPEGENKVDLERDGRAEKFPLDEDDALLQLIGYIHSKRRSTATTSATAKTPATPATPTTATTSTSYKTPSPSRKRGKRNNKVKAFAKKPRIATTASTATTATTPTSYKTPSPSRKRGKMNSSKEAKTNRSKKNSD